MITWVENRVNKEKNMSVTEASSVVIEASGARTEVLGLED